MKTAMNKQLYNFTQKLLQKNRQGGRIKKSASLKKLHDEYHFGQFDLNKEYLTFNLANILALCEEVKSSTLGIDIRNDSYPAKEDRLTTAENNRNEKGNSYAVSKDFVLINSLTELNINQNSHVISPLASLGTFIKADEINSVEHSAIVLVENLAVMANLNLMNLPTLSSLNLSQNIDLSQALWLYRGDIKKQQTTNTSYQFFRRFKAQVPLICFSDLDPKGIEIALTSDADYWLTLENTAEVAMSLSGSEQEWHKQDLSITFLLKQKDKDSVKTDNSWQHVFNQLLTYRKTLKQEHMLQHNLALTLLKLSKN